MIVAEKGSAHAIEMRIGLWSSKVPAIMAAAIGPPPPPGAISLAERFLYFVPALPSILYPIETGCGEHGLFKNGALAILQPLFVPLSSKTAHFFHPDPSGKSIHDSIWTVFP